MAFSSPRGGREGALFKHKIHSGDEAEESSEMVPVEALTLKEYIGDECKDDEGNDFLNHLEFNERERSAIIHESDAVGWYHHAILEEGDNPRENNDANEGPRRADVHLLEFQMSIPCECHEDIRHN